MRTGNEEVITQLLAQLMEDEDADVLRDDGRFRFSWLYGTARNFLNPLLSPEAYG